MFLFYSPSKHQKTFGDQRGAKGNPWELKGNYENKLNIFSSGQMHIQSQC